MHSIYYGLGMHCWELFDIYIAVVINLLSSLCIFKKRIPSLLLQKSALFLDTLLNHFSVQVTHILLVVPLGDTLHT
jgi:hypothetical protein